MQPRQIQNIAFVGLAAFAAASVISHAGPLDPPAGPPASSYKSLSEVEPRIAVSAATALGDSDSVYRITQPGSYYLTGDVVGVSGKSGVEIATSDVTLDLNGYTVRGVAGSLSGIVGSSSRYTIRNGRIFNWGEHGVSSLSEFLLEDLQVYITGGDGIAVGADGIVRRCVVGNAQVGIRTGFAVALSDCIAADNRSHGFVVGRGTLDGCTATSNGGDGIVASEAKITRCTASYNVGNGFRISLDTVVDGCLANSNGQGPSVGAGIRIDGSNTRVEGNSVVSNDVGIGAAVGGNIIVRNSARQNGLAYDIAPGNIAGPVVTPATVATDTNPHANYAF